jgi:hypothetical protein
MHRSEDDEEELLDALVPQASEPKRMFVVDRQRGVRTASHFILEGGGLPAAAPAAATPAGVTPYS